MVVGCFGGGRRSVGEILREATGEPQRLLGAEDFNPSNSREFCLNVEDTKSLNITFAPSMAASPDAYAFINGIEIVSMPSNLYYTPAPSSNRHNKKVCTEENEFRIENNTALEMLYRINIGGPQILFTQDTGMYRRWDGLEVEINYLQPLRSVSSHLQEFGSQPDFAV